MEDVAKASGFSQMTVSRAFDRSASIRDVTRKRILEAAAAIGYYHNRAAAIVASRRSRSFGIVLPTLQSSIYLPFVEAARRAFEHRRADYVLQTIDYARGREVQVIGALLSHRVEAILLPSIGHTGKTRRLLQNVPVPLIEVGNLPQEPIHFAVGHSDFDAGAVATERLIAMGCRRVAIICGHARTTSNARDRLEGYRHALQGAGLPAADELRAEVDHSIDSGLRGLERLLRGTGDFDGLVIGGEIWAAALLLKILQFGRRIPDDIAVVGIGEVELGPYLPVPLTSVALPRDETGRLSAEMALSLSEGEPISEPVVRLPVRLVASASG